LDKILGLLLYPTIKYIPNGVIQNGGFWKNDESLICWLLAENIRFENVKKYKNLHIMDNLMEWNGYFSAENIRFENVKKYKNLHIMDNLMEWNCWLLAENIRLGINRRPSADGAKNGHFYKMVTLREIPYVTAYIVRYVSI